MAGDQSTLIDIKGQRGSLFVAHSLKVLCINFVRFVDGLPVLFLVK